MKLTNWKIQTIYLPVTVVTFKPGLINNIANRTENIQLEFHLSHRPPCNDCYQHTSQSSHRGWNWNHSETRNYNINIFWSIINHEKNLMWIICIEELMGTSTTSTICSFWIQNLFQTARKTGTLNKKISQYQRNE